jgi:predicted ester cyclase
MEGEDIVEAQTAQGDLVVTRWTFRGRHTGEVFGVPATGKPVTMSGVFIDRVEDGKIVEHWDEADVLGLLQQIGALPSS